MESIIEEANDLGVLCSKNLDPLNQGQLCLNSVLDLMFTEIDKNNHPKLMKMLEQLTSVINIKLLIFNSTNNDYGKALESLHKAKLKCFPNLKLKKIINDIYHNVFPLTLTNECSEKTNLFAKSLREMLNYSEAKQIIPCLQVKHIKCDRPLLGITNLTAPQWRFNDCEELKRHIHLLLTNEAQSLVEFYYKLFKIQDNSKSNDTLKMTIILKENVRKNIEDFKKKQEIMRQVRVKRHDLIRDCKNNLTNLSSKTNALGNLQLNGKLDGSKLCLLQNKSENLDRKLRHFQLEVFDHVHIPEVISSYDNISTILDDYRHRVQCQITKSKHQLAAYESLGPRFQNLLATHTDLQDQIENEKALLQQWQARNFVETCQH